MIGQSLLAASGHFLLAAHTLVAGERAAFDRRAVSTPVAHPPSPSVRERTKDGAMVHGLLDSAHRHQRAAVRSEAGIGETALLDYLARRAEECRVIRAAGVEARWGLR